MAKKKPASPPEQQQIETAEQPSSAGRPIIIKRVKKGGHGRHGGAWKIAFADFMTAMMAFFLMMWLLMAAEPEQLAGLAEYFSPTSASLSTGGSGGIMGGMVIGRGARPASTGTPPVLVSIPPASAPLSEGGENFYRRPTDEEIRRAAAELEQREFEEVSQQIFTQMERYGLLSLAENLIIDFTAEGMRIQLIDRDGVAMFESGSHTMLPHARSLLDMLARTLGAMPQKISVTGHTDSVQFRARDGYSNWELSADRALASRRELIRAGIQADRIVSVVGKADVEPLVPENPAAPQNRRISLVLQRQHSLTDSGTAATSPEQQIDNMAISPRRTRPQFVH
ncbi:MAG: OmpA family protein [Alphaproteobacteria bacterium]|nr:OmpA family protein [Alphaproteobacteria bacterium]